MKMRPIHLILALLAMVLLIACHSGRRGASGARSGDPGGSSRPSGTPVCSNDCETATDGFCDDGGSGAESDRCELGTDCSDCGTRYVSDGAPRSGSGCSCDTYAGECECDCDPDCDVVTPPSTAGQFGDSCECYTPDATGFCESSGCDSSLYCFGYMGYGVCTVPCSEFDVGYSDVCPPGGQCQSGEFDGEIWYLCAPT
jgi:hypothetical protein